MSAADDPVRWELDRLVSYDNDSVLAEVRRVAALLPDGALTRRAFDKHSRVSSSACLTRWGSWAETLTAAGLAHRIGNRRVSDKMRRQAGRGLNREEMTAEVQAVAERLGKATLTMSDLQTHSTVLGTRAVLSRFGSWRAALEAAGLELSSRGRRYAEDDYFENLLAVWTHYGRTPRYAEMDRPPSRITSGGYAAKFGSWGRAKEAFVARMNADLQPATTPAPAAPTPQPRTRPQAERRAPSLGLRYLVLRRDSFKCVLCGRSPATDATCILHVDHVVAFSRGGLTTAENLRTTCEACNLGKSDRD